MDTIREQQKDGIATVTLARGKVNALNPHVVDQLRKTLEQLEHDTQVKALILTGAGKFFSFGFDIPEFLSFNKEEFTGFLTGFADLYRYLFLYPKPVVAALNGHTMAGGCMLALACDYRLMVRGHAKISLNEITFGASVFAGSVEMLRFLTGSASATRILCDGSMYTAEEAFKMGFVESVTGEEDLLSAAAEAAMKLSSKPAPAFASIKSLLRKPVADEWKRREDASIREFVEIWYSEDTWQNVRNIQIR